MYKLDVIKLEEPVTAPSYKFRETEVKTIIYRDKNMDDILILKSKLVD